MYKKEEDPVDQIRKIRNQIYNQTKDLTTAEYINFINQKANNFNKAAKKLAVAKSPHTFFKEYFSKKAS